MEERAIHIVSLNSQAEKAAGESVLLVVLSLKRYDPSVVLVPYLVYYNFLLGLGELPWLSFRSLRYASLVINGG